MFTIRCLETREPNVNGKEQPTTQPHGEIISITKRILRAIQKAIFTRRESFNSPA